MGIKKIACKQTIVISAAGRMFLRPREDLRQVEERFIGGAVDWCQTPRANKCLSTFR